MTQPQPRPQDPSRPTAGELAREAGRDFVRSSAEGLVVVLVTGLAILVVAGGLGWLGGVVAGTAGMVVGVLVGLGLVGLAWLVLVLTGAADALRRLRRR
ncbi:hypothetical protein MHY85_10660 [Cellulomonas sp. ACRRI]|uniref:hypothetical protein n=1 Tax=Cellulomonas sp. ACRRI TaxID=2918188 RepID=UPI001EF1A645|nr:hypothetical protein [Cellulomonas sp. ACRRI]MCG7286430.1 hypothetical protein [Cellulomonas sp. ACRRI]